MKQFQKRFQFRSALENTFRNRVDPIFITAVVLLLQLTIQKHIIITSAAEYWLLEEVIYIECVLLVQECTHCKSYVLYQNTENIFILLMFVLLSKQYLMTVLKKSSTW